MKNQLRRDGRGLFLSNVAENTFSRDGDGECWIWKRRRRRRRSALSLQICARMRMNTLEHVHHEDILQPSSKIIMEENMLHFVWNCTEGTQNDRLSQMEPSSSRRNKKRFNRSLNGRRENIILGAYIDNFAVILALHHPATRRERCLQGCLYSPGPLQIEGL